MRIYICHFIYINQSLNIGILNVHKLNNKDIYDHKNIYVHLKRFLHSAHAVDSKTWYSLNESGQHVARELLDGSHGSICWLWVICVKMHPMIFQLIKFT